jgi:hypothetical protein
MHRASGKGRSESIKAEVYEVSPAWKQFLSSIIRDNYQFLVTMSIRVFHIVHQLFCLYPPRDSDCKSEFRTFLQFTRTLLPSSLFVCHIVTIVNVAAHDLVSLWTSKL